MIKVSDLLQQHSKVKVSFNRETGDTSVYVFAYKERIKRFGFKHYLPQVECDIEPERQWSLGDEFCSLYVRQEN